MSDEKNEFDDFDFDFDSFNTDEPLKNTEANALNADASFGEDLAMAEAGVSADNPYLNPPATDESVGETSGAKTDKKKKGGWFAKSKDKPGKEKKEKPKKEKTVKEKVVKEKRVAGERAPLNLGTALCVIFTLFLLASLLMLNIAAILTREPDGSMMQTVCFLGAFNLVGLAAAAVPILFYKFPHERTLPNVMLGVAAVAMLGAVQIAVVELYRYGFVMIP